MMAQEQAIGYNELSIAQAEVEENIGIADLDAPNDNRQSLDLATQSILHHAFFLDAQKTRSKTEYKQLLLDLGWKGEEKRYLKVAAAFEKFSPPELAQIEPATIFRLANNSKKYQPVFEQMLELPEITQAAVRELIEQQRKPREPKSENFSIWRRTENGGRYCQIPPIHEEDEQTGVILQRAMDELGLSPQAIVREAVELWQAVQEGLGVAVEEITATVEEMPLQQEPQVIESDLSEEYLESAIAVVDAAGEPFQVEEFDATKQSNDDRDEWTFELEDEKDDDTVSYGDYAAVTSVVLETELTQTQILIQTFQTAASWQEISEVLKIHSEYKQQAWDALTPLEKRRVMEITPEAIKKLNEAKKAGMIADFRELREDDYQIQRQGSLFWEVVSKSRLDKFLSEL